MDESTALNHEEEFRDESENVSVSDLLSSFYDVDGVGNDELRTKEGEHSLEIRDDRNDVMFSNTVFGQEDFSVDSCLNDVLTKYSMLDLIALLRRLEREVRQFTAGKQLLIYDNYECLFSALDTVHEINTELSIVQKHLQALKASQIKASSIDISSRYGIRDKLIRFSELNRLLNVFQAFSSIAYCLSEAKKRVSNPSHKKQDVIELLDVVTRASVILNVVKERSGQRIKGVKLFHTFDKYIREILLSAIDAVTKVIKTEVLSHDEIVNICCNLAKSRLIDIQVWEYYWKHKSSMAKHRLENILKAVRSPATTLYTTSNEIVDFILFVADAVYSEGFLNLSKCLDSNAVRKSDETLYRQYRHLACVFCIGDDWELLFSEGENSWDQSGDNSKSNTAGHLTYSYYSIVEKSQGKCICIREALPQQFISVNIQLVFAALQHLVDSRSQKVTTNEVIFVLSTILDKIKSIRKDDSSLKYITDMSCRWMLLILLLYLQKLFYPIYNAVIDIVFSSSEDKNRDIFKDVEYQVEVLLKEEVTEILTFVDDMGNAMHISLRPTFSSFVVLYLIYLKTIFRKLVEGIIASCNYNDTIDYLCSLSSLLSVRGNTGLIRQEIVSEHIEISKDHIRTVGKTTNIMGDGVSGEIDVMRTMDGLSVDHFMDTVIKEKASRWSSTETTMRYMLGRILVLMYDFSLPLQRLKKAAIGKLDRASTLVTSGDLQVILQSNYNSIPSFARINEWFNLSTHLKYLGYINHLENVFQDDSIHLTDIMCKLHKCEKEGSMLTIPLPDLSKDQSNTLGKVRRYVEQNIEENFSDIAQTIISFVINGYIKNASRLIRYTMENVENGENTLESSIKDFTGMVYDMIEFLNSTSDAALVDEGTQRKIAEMNKRLNDAVTSSNCSSVGFIYDFSFLPSKDLCLKLFTIRIAQTIDQSAQQHVLNMEFFKGMLSRIEMQLLVAFRKSSDIDQMKRLFGKLVYPDIM